MKVRCPYCQSLFTPEGRNRCPQCGKTVLLPGFFGKSGKRSADHATRVLQRQLGSSRQVDAKLPFLGKPGRVILIMAVMIVVGGLLLRRSQSGPPQTELRTRRLAYENIVTLQTAVDQFRQHCGAYPTTREGLAALLLNPDKEGWRGPYILELKPDPWGYSFGYVREGDRCFLYSVGPDGLEGTPDDLRLEWVGPLKENLERDIYPARISVPRKPDRPAESPADGS